MSGSNNIAEDGSVEVSSDATDANLQPLCINAQDYDSTPDVIDNTKFGDTGKTVCVGLKAHVLTVSGDIDESNAGYVNLVLWDRTGGQRYIRSRFTVGATFDEREGVAELTNFQNTAAKGALTGYSATFQFVGAPTEQDQT